MFIKLAMIVAFFAVTLLVGVTAARRAKGVDGFVLGGRSVGPWLTAFSFGLDAPGSPYPRHDPAHR